MTDAIYEVVTRRINQEAEGVAYAVFDTRLTMFPIATTALRVAPFEADTIEELARAIGVPADEPMHTIEGFNAARGGRAGSTWHSMAFRPPVSSLENRTGRGH